MSKARIMFAREHLRATEITCFPVVSSIQASATPASSATAVNFSSAKEITGNYRVPMIAIGLAPAGSAVEISNVKLFEVK